MLAKLKPWTAYLALLGFQCSNRSLFQPAEAESGGRNPSGSPGAAPKGGSQGALPPEAGGISVLQVPMSHPFWHFFA